MVGNYCVASSVLQRHEHVGSRAEAERLFQEFAQSGGASQGRDGCLGLALGLRSAVEQVQGTPCLPMSSPLPAEPQGGLSVAPGEAGSQLPLPEPLGSKPARQSQRKGA